MKNSNGKKRAYNISNTSNTSDKADISMDKINLNEDNCIKKKKNEFDQRKIVKEQPSKGLSMDFMDSLSFLIENITECSRGDVRKAIKLLEREN
mgnify:CR=1 FL=1